MTLVAILIYNVAIYRYYMLAIYLAITIQYAEFQLGCRCAHYIGFFRKTVINLVAIIILRKIVIRFIATTV